MKKQSYHFIPMISMLVILIIDLAIIITTHQSWNSSMHRYVPLIYHIDKLNNETAVGHLWLEEAITGDSSIDINKQVLSRFQALIDNTDSFIINNHNNYTTPQDIELFSRLEQIKNPLLINFTKLAKQRWKNSKQSVIGSKQDQEFDKQFTLLQSHLKEIRETIHLRMQEEFKTREIYFKLILALFILVNILVFSVVYFTMRKISKAENSLRDEKEKAIVTLHSIGDAVITTDQQGVIQFINPVAEQLTQYRLSEAIDQPIDNIFKIISEESQQRIATPVNTVLKQGKIIGLANHTALIDKYGNTCSIEDSAAPIINAEGDVVGVVLVFHDISERRESDRKIHWQASHDHLTGLVNRTAFQKYLKTIIQDVKQSKIEHALLFIDLDQFKIVNDTVGHIAGDELLRQISALLSSNIRKDDLLSRFGGDEFGIIFNNLSLDGVEDRAKKILEVLQQYHFYWDEKVFNITASIGIVVINQYTHDEDTALSQADSACYIAKDKGRNAYFIAEIEDDSVFRRYEEMSWIHKIENALQEQQFILYAQTIKSLHDSENHFEILIRMKNDKDQIIMPERFIPVAERYNLMPKIDLWVIKTLLNKIQKNHQFQSISFAVNLSGQSLSNKNFISELNNLIELNKQLDFSKIIFEITETSAINNIELLRQFIVLQKKNGFRFSLDDFGTGLSSFTYLKYLPVDFIKIDGSFVKGIIDDQLDKAMVQAIHQLSIVANIQTIAEFVENSDILAMTQKMGINYAQGYEINIPEPLATHSGLLKIKGQQAL
jgi:diguanylate cyclase (GGDEF)-like protein/PAS domain S-box-containing protein